MKKGLCIQNTILKLVTILFLTLGCNLALTNHFWPNDIMPYVFLLLCAALILMIDKDVLQKEIYHHKVIYVFFCAAVIVCDFLLWFRERESYGGIIFLVKSMLKSGIAGVSLTLVIVNFKICIDMAKACGKSLIGDIIVSIIGLIYFFTYKYEGTVSFGIVILYLLIISILCMSRESVERMSINNKRSKVIFGSTVILLASCESFGYAATNFDDFLTKKAEWIFMVVFGCITWSFVYRAVLVALLKIIDSIPKKIRRKKINREFLLILFITLIMRVFFYLNWYPGIIFSDTNVQIRQAMGLEAYSNHHPWLFTLIIKIFVELGNIIGMSNQKIVGFAVLTLMVLSSFIAAWILFYFKDQVSQIIWFFMATIWVLDPINCIYSIMLLKDSTFSYILLAFSFFLIWLDEKVEDGNDISCWMLSIYIVLSFLVCVLRSNGLYVWFITCPFVLYHFRKKMYPWILATGIVFLCIIGYKGVILPAFDVIEPDRVESLSVPLQQIAYTIKIDGDMSKEDLETIANIANVEGLGEVYSDHISDPVKNYIREKGNQEWISKNMMTFLKTYISIGFKNPIAYLVAFLNQSKGFWYHKLSNYIYLKEGVHRFAGEIGVYRDSFFSENMSGLFDKLMDKYVYLWHGFWSLALSTYVMIICLAYCLLKKKPCYYFMPQVGLLLTLMIATPVNDEFRYVYEIYLAAPLMVLTCAKSKKCEKMG